MELTEEQITNAHQAWINLDSSGVVPSCEEVIRAIAPHVQYATVAPGAQNWKERLRMKSIKITETDDGATRLDFEGGITPSQILGLLEFASIHAKRELNRNMDNFDKQKEEANG